MREMLTCFRTEVTEVIGQSVGGGQPAGRAVHRIPGHVLYPAVEAIAPGGWKEWAVKGKRMRKKSLDP